MLVYSNHFIKVFDDEVKFSDDSLGHYVRIVPAGSQPGVVILALSGEMVGLVHSYRYPVGEWQWALPRGFAHGPDPLASARNELREELGIDGAELRLIGSFTPDSGLLASRVAVVAAKVGNVAGSHPVDDREIAAIRWVPISELYAMVAASELQDGMTLAALALARSTGLLGDPELLLAGIARPPGPPPASRIFA